MRTLTQAMTAILCPVFEGATPEQVMNVEQDFVPRIVGGRLIRVRRQAAYCILNRMKRVCRAGLNRASAAAQGG